MISTLYTNVFKPAGRFGLLLFVGFVLNQNAHAQTTLGLGDLAFVHFDRNNTPKQFSFIARKQIDAGTVFFITNNDLGSSNTFLASATSQSQSIIRVEVDQPLAPGEAFTINYDLGSASANPSDPVTAAFVEGSDFGFGSNSDKIWVYQADESINAASRHSIH